MDNCIVVDGVVKCFKETTALNNVSIEFERGKIHGVIGRNASGKTVLFKCMCGFMKPDSGKILVNGAEVVPTAPQDIGIIIEHPGFINSLSGYKNLKLLASVGGKISDDTIRNTMRMVGLDPMSSKRVGKYSLGMRQRLGIAQAIMEEPEILILDEPMNGLDKQGVVEIRELLLALKEQGKTIIMSSHYTEDIKCLCDTVCELDNGNIVRRTVVSV